jgi:hypothetical protein
MARYQLKPFCVFVDAYDIDNVFDRPNPDRSKPNTDIPFAHVMNKTTMPASYVTLNDGAAFIARFITMGVGTDLIPQILISEYGMQLPQAKDEVAAVLNLLYPKYLLNRTYARTHVNPASLGEDKHPTGDYQLDFKVNILGGGVLKGPL